MIHGGRGTHHLLSRKRLHKNLEIYPHKSEVKNFIDKLALFMGIVGPLMTIPQVWKIYYYQNASGVSAISWVSYLLNAIVWLAYGISHKEKPIIITNAFWIVLEIIVIFGTIIYG